LGEAIGKEAAKKLLRGCKIRFIGCVHGNMSGTVLHAHLINHVKRLCLLG